MPNMPTIAPMEIAVIGAALLLLYVVPFLLTTIEDYRARRAHRWSGAVMQAEPAGSAPILVESGFELPVTEATAPPVEEPEVSDIAAERHLSHGGGASAPEAAVTEPGTEVEQPSPEEASLVDEAAPPAVPAGAERDATTAPQAFEKHADYRFRLEDLHWVRLPNWPPPAVQSDSARSQLWSEAEGTAETHRAAILESTLLSPYPVRSTCFGGAERDQETIRLRFLLFPALWPTSPDQAAAQVVFEVQPATGKVQHRLEALQQTNLSNDTRRALRESGET